jgi:hypothetical protein
MCRKLACGVVGVMMLGSTVAEATDATMLAGRAGFLVEHAHRCGVAEYRLQRSAVLIKQLIAAFALDDEDGEAGQARFDENVLAGALADLLGDPMPSCDAVRSQLAVLEQHRQAAAPHPGNRQEEQMAGENRSGSAPAQPKSGAVAKPAKSEIPAATRRETVAQGVR